MRRAGLSRLNCVDIVMLGGTLYEPLAWPAPSDVVLFPPMNRNRARDSFRSPIADSLVFVSSFRFESQAKNPQEGMP
jgi:hypothetical protein